MQIFVSWSKERSQKIGKILCQYLPVVIQEIEIFFSPDDIAKGSRWLDDLSKTLQSYSIGLLCITPESLSSQWLYFEAGALSKSIDSSKVIPILFDIEPSDLPAPLAQFQSCKFSQEDIFKVIKEINGMCKSPLKQEPLETAFNLCWPTLESEINKVINAPATEQIKIPADSDKISEILDTVRNISKKYSSPIRIKEKAWAKNEVEKVSNAVTILTKMGNYISIDVSDRKIIEDALRILYAKVRTAGFPNTGRPINEAADIFHIQLEDE